MSIKPTPFDLTGSGKRYAAVGMLALVLGIAGGGVVGTPADTAPTYTQPDNTTQVMYTAQDGTEYTIYPGEGVVCASPSELPHEHCTYNPEKTLEHLNYLGYYDDHPDAPRPPLNNSSA